MKSIIIDKYALYILSAILLAEYQDLQVPTNPLTDKQNAICFRKYTYLPFFQFIFYIQ